MKKPSVSLHRHILHLATMGEAEPSELATYDLRQAPRVGYRPGEKGLTELDVGGERHQVARAEALQVWNAWVTCHGGR